jgi:hypothetical protein
MSVSKKLYIAREVWKLNKNKIRNKQRKMDKRDWNKE